MLNNLQDEFQSAYRTSFSTETALIKITDQIIQAFDCKSSSALIMIDMPSAFDTVDHNILLVRLSTCFGIKKILCLHGFNLVCAIAVKVLL